MSLYFTDTAARIKPVPRANTIIINIGIIDKNIVKCSGTLMTTITISNAAKAANILIEQDMILDRVNIYLGTYTFLSSGAL